MAIPARPWSCNCIAARALPPPCVVSVCVRPGRWSSGAVVHGPGVALWLLACRRGGAWPMPAAPPGRPGRSPRLP
eukprot:4354196-Alexandrium_andersonii.AAC.1